MLTLIQTSFRDDEFGRAGTAENDVRINFSKNKTVEISVETFLQGPFG